MLAYQEGEALSVDLHVHNWDTESYCLSLLCAALLQLVGGPILLGRHEGGL